MGRHAWEYAYWVHALSSNFQLDNSWLMQAAYPVKHAWEGLMDA